MTKDNHGPLRLTAADDDAADATATGMHNFKSHEGKGASTKKSSILTTFLYILYAYLQAQHRSSRSIVIFPSQSERRDTCS